MQTKEIIIMSEQITFKSFNPEAHSVYEIGTGVVPEMARVFNHELSEEPDVQNLGNLIGTVGQSKELQENIAGVQEKIGTNDDPVTIARGWVERSGLLLPVDRSYMNSETVSGEAAIDVALVTGGVRNWMQRRAQRLANESGAVSDVLLVAGNREMKPQEGDDVEAGMTEADYFNNVIRGILEDAGVRVELVRVNSSIGDEVMAVAANHIGSKDSVLVASNAGAWVQNAGQARRALQARHDGFDANGENLYVISDTFPLGSGQEPTSSHQNPFSALGQIARNAQELRRHQ